MRIREALAIVLVVTWRRWHFCPVHNIKGIEFLEGERGSEHAKRHFSIRAFVPSFILTHQYVNRSGDGF